MRYKKDISIIMPCYNAQKYIHESIKSVLNQSFSDFEFIIVNDGSIDYTKEIALSYNDKRIIYHERKINSGNYFARNLGLSISNGKYICMIDADDVCSINRLEKQFDIMQRKKWIDCLGSQSEVIDELGDTIGSIGRPLTSESIKISLLKNNCMTQSTLMFRKSSLDKYGLFYDEKYRYSGDYDLMVKLSRWGKLQNLQENLIKYRMHLNQISQTKRKEQISLANGVRLSQLDYIGMSCSQNEKKLFLKWMNGLPVTKEELVLLESLFNKLLVANHQKKFYNQNYLYRFLNRELHLILYQGKFY